MVNAKSIALTLIGALTLGIFALYGPGASQATANTTTQVDPLVNAEYFVVPDQQSEYISDDKSVAVTINTNTFSSPVRISLFRVFHGDGQATDNPNPVPPPTLETFASLLVGVFDPATDTDVEPEKPISIAFIADVDSDRSADLSTLRVVLEQADGLVPTNADIVRDSVTGRTSIKMEISRTGRYLVVADALAISITASPTATILTKSGAESSLPTELLLLIVFGSSIAILAFLVIAKVHRRTPSSQSNDSLETDTGTDIDNSVQ